MNNLEKLALCTAMEKGIKATIKELRESEDEAMYELFKESGVDRRQIIINGEKVGTQSVTFTKEANGIEPYIEDYQAFIAWLQTEQGYDTLRYAVNEKPGLFTYYLEQSGEVGDGINMREVHEPAKIKGTTVRVDRDKVFNAFGKELPSAVAGLLGGEV